MEAIPNPPRASSLIASIRSLGYSFDTAIADLIDNAISARAKNIQIIMKPSDDPSIIIVDDGEGMSATEIEESLRFGSKNPLEERRSDDLGRFGLGMKTASLSLCRKLTVASKQNGEINCCVLDLDLVQETNDWQILKYTDKSEISALPSIDVLEEKKSGTYILLESFDRIGTTSDDVGGALAKLLTSAEKHIALVFHRIISEDNVKILINDRAIKPKNPFLKNHKGTQKLREETIEIDDSKIILRPYVLPHRNQLTAEELESAGGAEDLRTNQGFYIYRCKRLIIWGTWFKILGKRELNKLARVEVDMPNTLDELWDIDVKKSSAKLPDRLKNQLYNSIKKSVFESEKVIRNTGARQPRRDVIAVWERKQSDEDGGVSYRINRDLPQIKMLEEKLPPECRPLLKDILKDIENALPSREIYLDIADGEIIEPKLDELIDDFEEKLSHAEEAGYEREALATFLLAQPPFCEHPNFKQEWSKKYE